jgi:hypothetical protein
VGVLAVGASAWAIVNGADPHASAVVAWAVVFFACAQTAAVSAFLAALRAAAIRREPATPADEVSTTPAPVRAAGQGRPAI